MAGYPYHAPLGLCCAMQGGEGLHVENLARLIPLLLFLNNSWSFVVIHVAKNSIAVLSLTYNVHEYPRITQ